MTPKKIVIIKRELRKKGGLEKQTLHLSLGLQQKGFDLTLLTKDPDPLPGIPTVSLVTKPFETAARRWLSQNPSPIIFGMDRDLFLTHMRVGNGVHAVYLKRLGNFRQWFAKLQPHHRHILQLEKNSFSNPRLQKILVSSHMVKEEIISCYPVDIKKIAVIPSGVEWEEIEPYFLTWEEGKKALCKQFGVSPHLFHFLFIGNNYQRKGLHLLLKAFEKIKDRDFCLWIIGKDKNLSRYRSSPNFRFLGPQENIVPFYQLADVMVIPSLYDPFANVTLEALAMGLFVISSPYNGGKEVLTSLTGMVFDNLAAALQLSMEKHKKTPSSSLFIRNSVKHLDFSHYITQLIDLL